MNLINLKIGESEAGGSHPLEAVVANLRNLDFAKFPCVVVDMMPRIVERLDSTLSLVDQYGISTQCAPVVGAKIAPTDGVRLQTRYFNVSTSINSCVFEKGYLNFERYFALEIESALRIITRKAFYTGGSGCPHIASNPVSTLYYSDVAYCYIVDDNHPQYEMAFMILMSTDAAQYVDNENPVLYNNE